MRLNEIAELTARRSNISKAQSSAVINNFLSIVHDLVASGEEVFLPRLGKFKFGYTNGKLNYFSKGYVAPHPKVRFRVNAALKEKVKDIPYEIIKNVVDLKDEDDEDFEE